MVQDLIQFIFIYYQPHSQGQSHVFLESFKYRYIQDSRPVIIPPEFMNNITTCRIIDLFYSWIQN
jgi:hypothetical protein